MFKLVGTQAVIAVSTFRPVSQCDARYLENQVRAIRSWNVFEGIILFGSYESCFASPKTRFIPWEDFPRLSELVKLCVAHPGWSCILNSDIVIGPNFPKTEWLLQRRGARCASSWRWQYEDGNYDAARVVDNGLDFFAASNATWRMVLPLVPPELRLGCQRWDTWLLATFNGLARAGLYGVTRQRIVFHPKHEGRRYGPHEIPECWAMGIPHWERELV